MSLNTRRFVFIRRVGQEDNKKLTDYQLNSLKQKSLELNNRFDSLFYDAECDSTDLKYESENQSQCNFRPITRQLVVLL